MDATETRDQGHLDEATWERLACGELTRPEQMRARTHIVSCAECTRIDKALQVLRDEALQFDPGVPQEDRPRSARSPVRWLAMAAGLVLALGATGYFLEAGSLSRSHPLTVRGTQADRPQALSPLGRQKVAPQNFSWAPLPHARGYQVTLFGADAQPLWTSPETKATTLPWPQAFAKGGTYYWQVVALPENVASELVDVTIGPAGEPR